MPGFPRMRVPREEQLIDLQDGFAGGLNTTGDSFELARNQMVRAENARLTRFGSARKRLGTQRTHAAALAAADIQCGYCWRKADGTVEHIVVCNGVFYSGGATYAIPMTWTSVAVSGGGAAISNTEFVDILAFRDASAEVVYLADGGDLLKYDGSTLTRVTATIPTEVRQLAVYNQRLFAITTEDQTIWYSDLNDGDTLGITPGGGQAVVRTFGNQRLTTIETLRDSLALFHMTGISRFSGLTQDDININAGVQGFSSDTGSLFPRSTVVVNGQCFFQSERGAYLINDSGVVPLESREKPDPTTEIVSRIPKELFTTVTGVHDRINGEIRWALPESGLYVYNYHLQSWTGPSNGIYVEENVTAQWEAINANGDTFVLFGSGDGFVRQADVPDLFLDDVLSDGTGGDAFTLIVGCKRMFTSRPENDKSLRWAYIFADLGASTSALIGWNIHHGSGTYTLMNPSSGALWGTGIWGSFTWGGTGASTFRIPLGGRGTYVDFTISDDGDATSIYSRVKLVAFDLGPRG